MTRWSSVATWTVIVNEGASSDETILNIHAKHDCLRFRATPGIFVIIQRNGHVVELEVGEDGEAVQTAVPLCRVRSEPLPLRAHPRLMHALL